MTIWSSAPGVELVPFDLKRHRSGRSGGTSERGPVIGESYIYVYIGDSHSGGALEDHVGYNAVIQIASNWIFDLINTTCKYTCLEMPL